MSPSDSDAADLDFVEARTGVKRYRELIEAGRFDYWPVIRARAARMRGEPEPDGPGPLRRAVNFAGAVAGHVAAGRPKADEATREARLAVCRTCHLFRARDGVCTHQSCGCYVIVKAGWADQKCPIGKW